MADLSKTDIKEVVVSALEPFAQAITNEFNLRKFDFPRKSNFPTIKLEERVAKLEARA